MNAFWIIVLIILGAFLVWQIFDFIRLVIKRVKEKKAKAKATDENKNIDSQESEGE